MKKMNLSRAIRYGAMHFSFWAHDAKDVIFGGRDPLIPPRRLDHNFGFQEGNENVALMCQYADLQPHHRVLDVGCGIGRVAKPLTKFLNEQGSYVGVDIVERSVKWMKQAYLNHTNFAFYHLDIHNSAYNPNGKYQADTVEFPFAGQAQFDVVFLFSVFTHMYPHHIHHYLKLIERQLKSNGRLFASVFINDNFAQTQQLKTQETGEKHAKRVFRQKTVNYYAPAKTNPEFAVAFDFEQLDRLFDNTGLLIKSPFIYGNWCNRPGGTNFYQDVIVATKQNASTSHD